MLSGVFATPTLRNCSGPPSSAAHPGPAGPRLRGRRRAPQTALRGPRGPSPAGWPHPGPKAPQRASRGRLRAGEGPRRSGGLRVSLRSLPGCPPGPRCSSRRALRRSRFRCPLGVPFSLSPLLYLYSINRHPPCQAPAVCPSPHFRALYGAVGYRAVRQRGPRLSYRHVTYPNGTYRRVTLPPSRLRLRTRKLRPSKLPRGNIRHRNIT